MPTGYITSFVKKKLIYYSDNSGKYTTLPKLHFKLRFKRCSV